MADAGGDSLGLGASTAEPDPAGMRGADRYDAFISYSHRDRSAAAYLEAALHRSARLKGEALRVFRDDVSLRASPDLREELRGALGAASWMILVASPEAAESRWVAEEVDTWVATRGAETILPVVVRGQFDWRGESFDDTASAIPAPLRSAYRAEPFVVDLRDIDQRRRPSLNDPELTLKVNSVAAVVLGCPKEDLDVRSARDQRRRQRIRRSVLSLVCVLLVLAVVLAVVANRQRIRAEDSETEARRAAADSEFRRIAASASAAPTRLDALALGTASLELADRAGRQGLDALRPLLGALGEGGLPLLRLEGRSPDEFMAGERQGIDISSDGSTLAYVANTGTVEVWDLVSTERRTSIPATELSGAATQVGLSYDGSLLVAVAFASPPNGSGELLDAAVTVFEITAAQAAPQFSGTVPVISAAAVGFGPDPSLIVIGESEGGIVVARHDGSGFGSTRLGTGTSRGRASTVFHAFSTDGRRACSISSADGPQVQVFGIEPPVVIADLTGDSPTEGFVTCLPEPCAADEQSFRATAPDGAVRCYEPSGREITGPGPEPAPLDFVSFAPEEQAVVARVGLQLVDLTAGGRGRRHGLPRCAA